MASTHPKHERVESEYELQLIHWQPASKRRCGRGPARGSSVRTIPSPPQPFRLLLLPRELLLHVADCLDLKSHSRLSRTCRYLMTHLQRHLFIRSNKVGDFPAIHYGLSKQKKHGKGHPQVFRRALYFTVPLDLNAVIWNGMTPLAVASRHGNLQGVKYLLGRGVEVDATGKTGLTPLSYALAALSGDDDELGLPTLVCRAHCVLTIEALLAAGADPTCRLHKSILGDGAYPGSANAVTVVLDTRESDEAEKRISASLTVHLIRKMVLGGVKLDVRGRYRFTPLEWAAAMNRHKLVDFLTEHGASVDYDLYGGIRYTPLGAAICESHAAMVEHLISKGATVNPPPGPNTGLILMSPLCLAIVGADIDTLRVLLKWGADPNLDATGPLATPLICLFLQINKCRNPQGLLDKVRMLLHANADPNIANRHRDTPLTLALGRADALESRYPQRLEIVKELLDHGADPNLAGTHRVAPLALCCRNVWTEASAGQVRTEVCKALVAAGADVNSCGAGLPNSSPLLEAMSRRHDEPLYGDESNDYLKLCALFYPKIQQAPPDTPADFAVTLTDVPAEGWNNPIVPILLDGGAKVSQKLLDRVIY